MRIFNLAGLAHMVKPEAAALALTLRSSSTRIVRRLKDYPSN
jgi:hypothetical protein